MINRALKMGEKVKIVGNSSGHSFSVGSYGKVTFLHNAGQCHPTANYQVSDDRGAKFNCYQQDLDLCAVTRAEILKEAESLREKIASLDAQVAYLDETKSETFDDLEWRCYQALKAIKNSDDTVETSKVVAKLVRNEI